MCSHWPLTVYCAVTSYLNLCTVLFETLSALLTTGRVLQGARVAGAWRLHRQGLVYLVFKEGAPLVPHRTEWHNDTIVACRNPLLLVRPLVPFARGYR